MLTAILKKRVPAPASTPMPWSDWKAELVSLLAEEGLPYDPAYGFHLFHAEGATPEAARCDYLNTILF